MLRRIKSFIVKLNLFQSTPPSIDPIILAHQRLSTRIFLFLLVSSVFIIFLYLNLTLFTNTALIDAPIYSQYLDLYAKRSDTLVCQCSQVSVTYQQFLRIKYFQHQICTSDFTGDAWLDYLKLNDTLANDYFTNDFRFSGTDAFQMLRRFCQFTNRTITNNLIQFNANQYITTTVTARDTMQSQIQTLFDRFVLSSANDLQSSLALLRKMTHVNAYWSARMSNFAVMFYPGEIYARSFPLTLSDCSCLVSSFCKTTFDFFYYDGTTMHMVPGLYQGCFLTEGLLQSDLHCLYNHTCISQLQFYINRTTTYTFHPLNSTLTSRFTPTSSVQELMDKLMIETWNLSFSHEDYYQQCRPSVCTYTYSARHDFIYIITTMFSLIGGLITVLKILIPHIVIYGRKQLQTCRGRDTNAPVDRMTFIQFVTHILYLVMTFNLFKSVPPSTDELVIRQQRISTRLYIALLSFGIIILFTYMTLVPVSRTVTIPWPDIVEYEKLYEKYSQTLSCPCSTISTRYDYFLHVEYVMHDVCRSAFITSPWVEYLIASTHGIPMYTNDFRWTSKLIFQGLQMFCELSNQTIDRARDTFYTNQYVTNILISKHTFELQTFELTRQFISTTTIFFLSSIKSIMSLFQTNGLLSVTGVQSYIARTSNNDDASISSYRYENCDCFSSATCIAPSKIFNSTNDPVYMIPDMYFGCNMVEALLQSSLVCLYHEICIKTFLLYLTFSPSMNITPLNTSTLQKHHISSTVQELTNDLMVEQWKTSTVYENYYSSCRPTYCKYVHNSQDDFVYVVTTLLGLIGGLVTVLRLTVPHFVKSLDALIKWKRGSHADHQGRNETNNHVNVVHTIRRLSLHIVETLRNFNYFVSSSPSTDPMKLREQRVATRLLIVIVLVSMTSLLVYHGAMKTTKIVTITSPSFEQYSSHIGIYSDALICQCSQINIEYSQFLTVNYHRHPLCYSTFVSNSFRNAFFPTVTNETLAFNDFRMFGSLFFQGLHTICEMTNRTIVDNLDRFYLNQYITATVSSPDLFHSQTQAIFNTFLSAMTSDLLNNLGSVHEVFHANALFSARFTNFHFALQPVFGYDDAYWVGTNPVVYDGCDCSVSTKCVARASLLNRSNSGDILMIPGFYIGCYIIEALLQSTLECLFHVACLSSIRSYLLVDETMIISSLNVSSLQQSLINSTIQQLLENLLVEEWNVTTAFADYYYHCAPSKCTYMASIRNDPIYVITTMFGLLGGLVAILKVLLPIAVNIVMLTIRNCEQRGRTRVAIIQR